MGGWRSRWRTCRDSVRGNWQDRGFWASRPDNAFTRDGFEVIEGFLDREQCQRLARLADEHLPGPSHRVAGDCYTWVKSEASHGRNTGVRELLNVQSIDPFLAELLQQRTLQQLFEERLGERVELYGFGIQHDGIDTSSKRGFHIDCVFPPQLKAFVYLNDVEVEGDGPYTIVPGSHRWYGRKVVNDVANALTTGAKRDMRFLVPDRRLHTVLAPAGTLILSTQDAIHKGWTDHWRTPRHALVAYGTTAPWFQGGSLTEGIEFLQVA